MSFSFRVKGFGYPVLFNIYISQGESCSREKPGSFLETTHEATGGKRILSEADDLSVSSPLTTVLSAPFGLSSFLP